MKNGRATTQWETVVPGRSALLDFETHHTRAADGAPLVLTRRRPHGVAGPLPAVLLVHGLCQNRYTWHLSDRSLAGWLAQQGMDVFVAELRGHGLSRQAGAPYPKSYGDYADLDAPALLKAASEISGQPRVYWVGHSLGGIIGYTLAPHQARVAGIITIGSPAAFGADSPLLAHLGRLWVLLDRATLLRFLPYTGFPAEPVGLLGSALLPYLDRKNRFPVQMWVPGSMRRAALRERLRIGFDRSGRAILRQMLGEWALRKNFRDRLSGEDYNARLDALDVPLLLMLGDRDAVARPRSVWPVMRRAQTRDKTLWIAGLDTVQRAYGHLDLVLGDHAPEDIWPRISGWIAQRAQ